MEAVFHGVSHDRAAIRMRVERLAWVLDDCYIVPGLRYRFGWDAILALIPGVGPLVSTILSCLIFREAALVGAPPSVVLRMLFNIGFEYVVSLLPLVGTVFDILWKSNRMNAHVLMKYMDNPVATKKESRIWLAFAFGSIWAVFALATYTAVQMTVWLYGLLHHWLAR
ncbi:MAG: DUF4112 domain-containing protein [Bdellovibrionales bacterium]|nr:DUF4112 domain-containing protein [Bdellovibrionales bacterium]